MDSLMHQRCNAFSPSTNLRQAIIVNIFGPNVERMPNDNLKQWRYVTVYTDASSLADEFIDSD